jgi:hypothetical protein
MLSDDLRKLFESASGSEPIEARAALATLLRLAREVECDREEVHAYHDQIEWLHREAHAAVTTARDEWDRMVQQDDPDEHRRAAERVASHRAEISDIKQEIVRYRGLLVTSLERVRDNCRKIRALSIEHGFMKPAAPPVVDAPEVPQVPREPDHGPPAVAGAADGQTLSRQSEVSRLRRSSCPRLIVEAGR